MIARRTGIAVGAAVIAVVAVAIVVEADRSSAAVFGGLAVALAAALAAGAAGSLGPEEPEEAATIAEDRSDPLAALTASFEPSTLARTRAIALVESLEYSAGVRTGASRDPEELDRLHRLPPRRFEAWLEEALDRLEAAT
jgi:hypothetical protein